MAEPSRFASPVNDATEERLRLTRIPEKTKSATAWGVRVRSDWATARASATVETAGHAPVRTPLLQMQVEDLAYWMSKFVLEVIGHHHADTAVSRGQRCVENLFFAQWVHRIPMTAQIQYQLRAKRTLSVPLPAGSWPLSSDCGFSPTNVS